MHVFEKSFTKEIVHFLVDLRKGVSNGEILARGKTEIVHHIRSGYASSIVGGPWNEESLWKRAGELG